LVASAASSSCACCLFDFATGPLFQVVCCFLEHFVCIPLFPGGCIFVVGIVADGSGIDGANV